MPDAMDEASESGTGINHEHDGDGEVNSNKREARAGPVAKIGDDDTSGRGTTVGSTINISDIGSDHGSNETNINTSIGHHKTSHTNNGDTSGEDGDDNLSTTRMPSIARATRFRGRDKSRAQNAEQLEETQEASESKDDKISHGDYDDTAARSPITRVTRSQASHKAQAKNVGRWEEKQKARKSTPDEVSRHGNNYTNGRLGHRAIGSPASIPQMSSVPAVAPRAEAKGAGPASRTPSLEAMEIVCGAPESEAPAWDHGSATELASKANGIKHNKHEGVVKPRTASVLEEETGDNEQGGRDDGTVEAKKPRKHPIAAASKQNIASNEWVTEKTHTPIPRDPLVMEGPNYAPGSPDHSALGHSTVLPPAKKPTIAPPSVPAPSANVTDANRSDAPKKRGRGRPRKVAPLPRETSATRRVGGGEGPLDKAAVPTKSGSGDGNSSNRDAAIATPAREGKAPEQDSGNKPTEESKPSRPRGRPRKQTAASPVAPEAAAVATQQLIGGDTEEDRRRPPIVQEEPTPLRKKASPMDSTIRGEYTDRNEGSLRQAPSTTTPNAKALRVRTTLGMKTTVKSGQRGSASTSSDTANHFSGSNGLGLNAPAIKQAGAQTIPWRGPNVSGSTAAAAAVATADRRSVSRRKAKLNIKVTGKTGKTGDAVEVSGGAEEGDDGISGPTVFGVLRQKAATIEVLWEVDVQTIERNTEKVQ